MKILAAAILLMSTLACGSKSESSVKNSNSTSTPLRAEKLQADAARPDSAPESPSSGPAGAPGRSQGGEPVDTSKLDADIAAAEETVKSKPNDPAAKKKAAAAYFNRAVALTDVRQYAAALGDYRRALKYDPTDAESKKWIDQIVSIYGMLKKPVPAEGQEPPPLPFKNA